MAKKKARNGTRNGDIRNPIAAPRAAPLDTPVRYGSPSGFLKIVCVTSPEIASIIPMRTARIMRGIRT